MAQYKGFGGTAKTYVTWAHDGEPFKEDGKDYILVIPPKYPKERKKVRWYRDAAHHNLMPHEYVFPGKPFGFTDAKSRNVCIKECYLTPQERQDIFAYYRNKPTDKIWSFGLFFGGIWYRENNIELPQIHRRDKFFFPTWDEFKAAAQAISAPGTWWFTV